MGMSEMNEALNLADVYFEATVKWVNFTRKLPFSR